MIPAFPSMLTITRMAAGQLQISLILDHFGAFCLPQQPVILTRLVGGVLVISGMLLVRPG